MPLGDGTGPNGFGPRTGRGLGYCNGYNSPGYLKGYGWGFGYGRGFGRGAGFGRGWGARFGAYYNPYPYDYGYGQPVNERDYLRNEIDILEKNLKEMRDRLEQIEKQEEK